MQRIRCVEVKIADFNANSSASDAGLYWSRTAALAYDERPQVGSEALHKS